MRARTMSGTPQNGSRDWRTLLAGFIDAQPPEAPEDWRMDVVTLLTVAVLVGWLATLSLQARIDNVSVADFTIAVTGAALAGGVLAPYLGIAPTGEYGLSLSGTVISWAGATALLAVTNLLRYGRLQCDRRSAARRAAERRASTEPLTLPRND